MDYIQLEKDYGADNYSPLPVAIAKGKGAYVWDIDGKKYLDMMSAYSAVNQGHCHPRIVEALTKQAHELGVISRAFFSNKLGPFLQKACNMSGFPRALPMNTGAEAVETAIKAARRWGYQVKNIPENKAEIIVCNNNFHGRTTTIISFSTDPEARKNYGPYTPGFKHIPHGDSNALREVITENTAAFIVEPIQGEGGIIVPSEGYLAECAKICKENNVLLICDEIQTGLGRTGKLFCYQYDNIKPDGLVLGKALGGGMIPVSLFLTNDEVMDVFDPGSHGSTFGGYPIADAVAYEALSVLEDEKLTERAADLGKFFTEKLKEIDSPLIKDVRGRGLMIGLELTIPAKPVCKELLKKGLLCKDTRHTTIRLAPPLVVTEEELANAVQQIASILKAKQTV